MSRWVLPVPESPSSTTGSPASIQAAGGEVAEGGRGEVGDAGVVEVGEPFGARELGLVDQPDPAPGVPVVAFGGQHLGEERLVGQPLLGRRRRRSGRPRRGWWAAAGCGTRLSIAASAAGSASAVTAAGRCIGGGSCRACSSWS